MSKNKDLNVLKSLMGDEVYNNVNKLYEKTKPNNEFEFIFSSKKGKYLTQDKYINILKYLKIRRDREKLESLGPVDTLDIIYDSDVSYRVTLEGTENLNTYMKKLNMWNSHVIFSNLVKMYTEKKTGISLMKKIKESDNTIDIDELDMRARLSLEEDVTKSEIKTLTEITHTELEKITFRFKHRTSLFVLKKDSEFVRIDVTMTRTTKNPKRINITIPNYELEIEYGLIKGSTSTDAFNTMLKESEIIHKILQQSNYIINNSTAERVLSYYKQIASVSATATNLDARQPVSLEIQHITEVIPDRYAVTDKADGDRYFLVVMNKHVYFISTNLNVRESGIDLKDSGADGTICDGEYIFVPKLNRHIYMIFDCLMYGSTDLRAESSILKRQQNADELVEKYFIFGKQQGYKSNTYNSSGEFNLDNIVEHHKKEIRKFYDALDNDIQLEKDKVLVRRKYFIPALGAKKWEIFRYSEMIWKLYTEDSTIKCPYLLDGLIYHPIEQAYVTNARESKLSEFKWKPPQKNSIDFYIEFEKDKETRKVITVYDNSNEEYVRNKPYRICKLYVGKKIKVSEQPVLFREREQGYWAYIFLEDGEARDVEGNIISDNTVVEFAYSMDPEVPERFRWIPLRTRHDKTESVLRFGKRYGNYIDIADKVWRSISVPILISDISDLAKGNNPDKNIFLYDKKIEALRNKIGHEIIVSASKENAYYQKITNLAKPMRQFHNFIKSNMIYTYFHPMYENNKQLSIFEFGCGRGGDIMKYYYAKASYYVGIDISKEGITSPIDGAISRYNQSKRTHPDFPKMHFIHADGGSLLNYEEQSKALGGMNTENKQLIEKFFPTNGKVTMFDRVNCQFVMHYFLKDATTWSNFKQNLNMVLRNGGYFLATCFDGVKVAQLLKEKNEYLIEYTDEKGKKIKLFEIVKKYEDLDLSKPIKTGVSIDLYAAWMFAEGNYITEYLVDDRFIVPDLLESCDLELVDDDSFERQMVLHRDYLTEYIKYESVDETKKFLTNVSAYYDSTEINKGCYPYTNLTKYYVFRKKDSKSNKQKGGESDVLNFSNTSQYVIPDLDDYDDNYSYYNSIHNILRTHNLIPKSLTVEGLFKDMKIKLKQDFELDTDNMKKVCKKISLENEIDTGNKVKTAYTIDGLSVFIVERDCNDHYDVNCILAKEKYGKNDKAILLMKEGDLYKPLYRKIGDKQAGIINLGDKIAKDLMSQSDIY